MAWADGYGSLESLKRVMKEVSEIVGHAVTWTGKPSGIRRVFHHYRRHDLSSLDVGDSCG